MPVGRTEICNMALALISEDLVTDITNSDEGEHAVKTNALYPFARDEVLEMHKWKCATKLVQLAQTTAPIFGYTYAYTLPVDYIRMVSVNDVDPDLVSKDIFERVAGTLHTDETSVKLRYVARIDEYLMSPGLIKCIYTYLAAKLAWAIQQNRTLQEQRMAEFERAMRDVKYIDTMESRKPIPSKRSDSNWIPARYSSTNG